MRVGENEETIFMQSRISVSTNRHQSSTVTTAMFAAWGPESYVSHRSRAQSPTPSSSSASSSTSSAVVQKRQEKLKFTFAQIWERFNVNALTRQDILFLDTTAVDHEDYEFLSEAFTFRRGVELKNSHVNLIEVPSRPHESTVQTINNIVGRTYDLLPGGDICSYGSASTYLPPKF